MALTVASAITRCQRMMGSITDTIALEYLQLIHNVLCFELPLNVTEETVNVTANTREYTLNTLTRRVWLAEWVASANQGDRIQLRPTDFTKLNEQSTNWRRRSSARPTHRYVWRSGDDFILGLDPMPSVSTSGGYPVVKLQVSRSSTLASDGNLPEGLLSDDVYVFGAMMKHCMDHNVQDRLQQMEAQYEKALQKERDNHGWFDVQAPPSLTPNWLQVGGAV